MSQSRSHSRASIASSRSNQSINFRTITRDRLTHRAVKVPPQQQENRPSQSKLQQMLRLTSSQVGKKNSNRGSSFSQRKFYNDESPQKERALESSFDGKNTERASKHAQKWVEKSFDCKENSKKRQNNSRLSREPTSRLSQNNTDLQGVFNSDELEEENLEGQLKELVAKKLKLIQQHLSNPQHSNPSLLAKKSIAIDAELRDFMAKMAKTKEKQNRNRQFSNFLDKKIQYIETLLAEQNTEGLLMKKFFAKNLAGRKKNISDNNRPSKSQITEAYKSWKDFQKQQKSQMHEQTPKRSLPFKHSSINQVSFKMPNPQDYVPPKEKAKPPELNLQPLPRSSYKRDYLVLKTQPMEKIKASDNKGLFPRYFKDFQSNYEKDFKRMKTQIINHKEIDAYKDKFNFLKINYIPKRKSDVLEELQQGSNSKVKRTLEEERRSLPRQLKTPIKISETESRFSKQVMMSEAKRQFVWGNMLDRSCIKHKKLKDLEYRFKNLYKA